MTQPQRGGRFSVTTRIGVAVFAGVFLLALAIYSLYSLITVPMPATTTATLVSCLQTKNIPFTQSGDTVYVQYRYSRSAQRACY